MRNIGRPFHRRFVERFLILGLDEPLRRQVLEHLTTAFPAAEIRSGPLPTDPAVIATFAAFSALLVGCDDDGYLESLLGKLRRSGAPVLLLARGGSELTAVDAIRAGAADVISVPTITPPLLAARVRAAMQSRGAPGVERRRPQTPRTELTSELPAAISGYRVLQTLAESDRSAVYLAYSEELGANVALKVLWRAGDFAGTATDLERFTRENRIIAEMRHPAIVDVFDFGSTSELNYIATEYFPAGNLKTRLQNPMNEQEALGYVRQIAEALRVIHVAGVLHRDLKPANVMLRADNSVVLIDFGLAKSLAGDKALTGVGEIRGSPNYMSPEQAEGIAVDERSDLYSMGVIFFELLTGRKPFYGRTVFDILAQHQHAPIPDLGGAVAGYQPLINRLLAKRPAERFQSASDFLLALQPR